MSWFLPVRSGRKRRTRALLPDRNLCFRDGSQTQPFLAAWGGRQGNSGGVLGLRAAGSGPDLPRRSIPGTAGGGDG